MRWIGIPATASSSAAALRRIVSAASSASRTVRVPVLTHSVYVTSSRLRWSS